MSNFTKAGIKFIRESTAAAIAHEKGRLGPGYLSSTNADAARARIKIAQGILAKLEEANKPITPEWLRGMGATAYGTEDFVLAYDAGVVGFGPDGVFLVEREKGCIYWPRIENRHDFSKLYRLLAGKELEQ